MHKFVHVHAQTDMHISHTKKYEELVVVAKNVCVLQVVVSVRAKLRWDKF
jgi:hypothetical protein